MLSDASGTGKTGTCARLIALFCGFYFNFQTDAQQNSNDSADYHGSRDLSSTLNSLADRPDFRPISDDPAQIDENRRIARESFMLLLLARLIVFQMFLLCKPSGVSVVTWKMQWAVLQLVPSLSYKGFGPHPYQDIFQYTLQELRGTPALTVHERIGEIWGLLQASHAEYVENFYLTIDGAQVGAYSYCTSHFPSREEPALPCSALTEMRAVFAEFGIFSHSVVSGTSVSEDQIVGSVQSTTARLYSSVAVVGISDGFYGDKKHRDYIIKHLRPWVQKCKIPEKSFQRLVDRMLDLLYGR